MSGEAGPGPGSCFPLFIYPDASSSADRDLEHPRTRPALPRPAVLYTHKQGRSYLLLVQMLKMYAMNVLKFFEEDYLARLLLPPQGISLAILKLVY